MHFLIYIYIHNGEISLPNIKFLFFSNFIFIFKKMKKLTIFVFNFLP